MSKLASSFFLFLFAALAVVFGFDLDQPPEQAIASDRVVITRVIDGDTVEILDGSKSKRVRFIGIDTPEVGECYFDQSKEYLTELAADREVIIESDPTQDDTDRYDRLLRYVYFPNGVNIGEVMIRNGYANEYTYEKRYKHQDLFKQAEFLAIQEEQGLHDVCSNYKQN